METATNTTTGQEYILKVSPEAARAAAKFMESENLDKAIAGVRVAVSPGGCSGFKYNLVVEDKPLDDDAIEIHEGIRFFVDPFSGQYLQGVEVDYVSSLAASGFKFTNPNSTGGCGCGSSFGV